MSAATFESELPRAQEILERHLRTAVFGQIGGLRPDKTNRATSTWGGNFLAAPEETVPTATDTSALLQPVLQIRTDELPTCPPALNDIALLTFWLDLHRRVPLGAENGMGFVVRTYGTLDDLIPIGPGYGDANELPMFPVTWPVSEPEQPGWEDIAFSLPTTVATAAESDWFFANPVATRSAELDASFDIKVGGWPQWRQGSQWPDGTEFVLQLNTSAKGRVDFGPAGGAYLFRGPQGWILRTDCY